MVSFFEIIASTNDNALKSSVYTVPGVRPLVLNRLGIVGIG